MRNVTRRARLSGGQPVTPPRGQRARASFDARTQADVGFRRRLAPWFGGERWRNVFETVRFPGSRSVKLHRMRSVMEPSDTFLMGAEVWIPEGDVLRHQSGDYGRHLEFARVSAAKTFRKGEGLPGLVWEQERPAIWTELGSHFVREEVASISGIDAALAFPVFGRDSLTAVVVLLFGTRVRASGVVEIWQPNHELQMITHAAGYYGGFERFGRISRLLEFQIGSGLPGLAWESGLPQLVEEERTSSMVRQAMALESGIDSGIAIPIQRGGALDHVVMLLSAQATPMARAFEVWVPDKQRLVLHRGRYARGLEAFEAESREKVIEPGQGLPGVAFQRELPIVFENLRAPHFLRHDAAQKAGLEVGLAIPIFDVTGVSAVACLLA